MKIGFKALAISANAQMEEDEEGEKEEIGGWIWGLTIFFSLLLSIGLFFVVPVGLTSLIKDQLGSPFLFWLVEGILRTAIFIGYIVAISKMPDLRRVFEYHGAEHKTISCYEAEDELIPSRAKLYSRLHPRCGTSFLLIVMVLAIFVFAPIGLPAWYWLLLSRILGIPLIAGLSYEVIKWAGKNRRKRWVRAVMWPGLMLQNLTTREPDEEQLAVAIASLDAVLARGDLQSRPRSSSTSRSSPSARRHAGLPRRLGLSLVIEQLVEQIRARFAELEEQMSDPAVIGDRERYAEVGREYRELQPARELAVEYATLKDDLEGARELLEEGEDEELRKVVDEAPARLEQLEEEIRLAMVERDPNDDKNVIVEIRGGTGGDEAALFAGDLYKMLTRYAEERGFATEVLSQSASEVGGFKDVTFAVKGDGAYSVFKFEGGTHRVQRVPETESQGRIHTSTATIAVLPEAEEVEVEVDQNDLQIDVFRSSGPGRTVGQHDRLGGADHPQTDRHRRLDAGREVPAAEQGPGDAGAAGAAVRARAGRAAGEDRLRAQGPGRQRPALGEGPHLQLPPGPGHRPPDQAHLAQPRRGARRRPLGVHRRARGGGEAPATRDRCSRLSAG